MSATTTTPPTTRASLLLRKPPRRRGDWLKHVLLTAFLLLMVYPLIWMIVSSLKPGNLILSQPGIIPSEVSFDNYRDGWGALGTPFSTFFLNSLIVTVGSIVGNLVSCSLAAYALARLQFRGRRIYFGITLASVMLPLHVLVVPQYIFFSQLELLNTYYPLLIPKFLATDAFFTFLMVQFIRTIPRELDQAAAIDGAGPFRTFWSVILPLMKPALVTTTVFTFIWTWNDFFTPLIYLTSTEVYTAPVALNTMVNAETQSGVGPLFAMSLLSLVPVLFFFVVAQKYLIRGIATTGLK
ncbi:carbohydrate ABC transporter permease [Kineococcus sp. SYSU DK003]|uniref:carbohydrate ABC transporter permease n=1 Tax=Kineococcus sp. SYSU DK003 TaxID=3383124 RepID=UPI003D7E1F00